MRFLNIPHKTKQILFFLGLFWSLQLPAQPIAIMLDKVNILQAGVPNPIKVVVSDLPMERLFLQVSQGEVIPYEQNQGLFYWKIPQMRSQKAWLILADSSIEHPIDTFYYRVESLSEPRFFITKAPFSTHGGIYGIFDGYCSEYLKPQIKSFEITIIAKDLAPLTFQNLGPRFNETVVEHLTSNEPGTKVIIDKITWSGGFDPAIRQSEEVFEFELK
jgi:hypothetical protein